MKLLNIFIIFSFQLMMIKPVNAATPAFTIKIENHLFHPSEVRVPANTKFKLVIKNNDKTSEEFESYELNREKIILGNRKGIIFIAPLKPGAYPFFGEFYPETALGKIIAVEEEK